MMKLLCRWKKIKSRTEQLRAYNLQVQQKQQAIFSIKTKMQNVEFDAKQKAKEQGGQLQSNIAYRRK
jgi:hypothetical protein